MNVLFYLLIAIGAFILASRYYSRYIARKIGEDPKHPVPSVLYNDRMDYVPTKSYVVFGHHFSSIAGAGPIVGPVIAFLYGFLPAWIWIVVGGIFIGAVHDFTVLFTTMREGGKSIAEVARRTLGKTGFKLVIVFAISMLVLLTSAFLSATAVSLTSLWPLSKLGVTEGQTFLKTIFKDGIVYGRIGGIASTSVILITLSSPVLGWLIYKKGLKTFYVYLTASTFCIISILVGITFPLTLDPETWMIVISLYVLLAAGAPVWLVLQPRDFINVQILYGGMILMISSLLLIGLGGGGVTAPEINLADATDNLGYIWPMMFITIACGAISGLHALVAGGLTNKQVPKETDARKIGYNAMLLESVLAICVLLALGNGLNFNDYKDIVWPVDPVVKSNPILAFSLAAGTIFYSGLGIPVALGTIFGILLAEGFVITTLDSAVRLNRYLFEELWNVLLKRTPKVLKSHWVNAAFTIILMLVLCYTNAFNSLWPIFGAANQLFATLALLTVSAWLLIKGRKYSFTMIPAVFMIITTIFSLIILLPDYYLKQNYILFVTDILLLMLSAGVILLVFRRFTHKENKIEKKLEEAVV